MVMFAVVLGAVLTLWDTASNAGYNEGERNIALAEETTGMDRMARDLRQAFQLNGPTSSATSDWIDIVVRNQIGSGGQADYRVIYDCSQTDPSDSTFKACIRYQSNWTPGQTVPPGQLGKAPNGATSAVVVPRVLQGTSADPNDHVFSGLTNPQGSAFGPTYGQITIRTDSRGERHPFLGSNYNHDVVLSESFYLRQLDFGR